MYFMHIVLNAAESW